MSIKAICNSNISCEECSGSHYDQQWYWITNAKEDCNIVQHHLESPHSLHITLKK